MGKNEEGNMPEKTVYSITQKGMDHFYKLMGDIASTLDNFYFNFNAVIANIDKVDKEAGLRYLETIRTKIYESKGQINANYEFRKDHLPYYGVAIIELYHEIFNTVLVEWIDKFIDRYRKM